MVNSKYNSVKDNKYNTDAYIECLKIRTEDSGYENRKSK